jgi:hypothetical protein
MWDKVFSVYIPNMQLNVIATSVLVAFAFPNTTFKAIVFCKQNIYLESCFSILTFLYVAF